MVWNYFTTRHGKGEVDGIGALLKKTVVKGTLETSRIENSKC
jgi:hypothetical protein